MTKTSPHVALNGSRLVRILTDLSATKTPLSHDNFADRLGRLVDLSDSIKLSAVHAGDLVVPTEEPSTTYEEVLEEVLRVRTSIVKLIAKSFDPRSSMIMGLQLPMPKEGDTLLPIESFEPYARFYGVHQRDMEMRVNSLRDFIRVELAGVSSKYTQLSTLDTAIDQTIDGHARRLLSVVPRLLGRRFAELARQYLDEISAHKEGDGPVNKVQNPEDWMLPGAWLATFCEEMKSILLAELDIRLQPALGLIEALNQEVNKVHE